MACMWLLLLFSLVSAEECRQSTVYSYECMISTSSPSFDNDNLRLFLAFYGRGNCDKAETKAVGSRRDLRAFTDANIAESAKVYHKSFQCHVCQCANGGDARREWPDKLDCMLEHHPLKNRGVDDLCQKYGIVLQPDDGTLTNRTTTAIISTTTARATLTTLFTTTPTTMPATGFTVILIPISP